MKTNALELALEKADIAALEAERRAADAAYRLEVRRGNDAENRAHVAEESCENWRRSHAHVLAVDCGCFQ